MGGRQPAALLQRCISTMLARCQCLGSSADMPAGRSSGTWAPIWSRSFGSGRGPRPGQPPWPHRGAATCLSQAASASDVEHPAHDPARTTVAVALSGGVDSAVAAMLLRRAGYHVVGVFMRNWDAADEAGAARCALDDDRRDAQAVCRHLARFPRLSVPEASPSRSSSQCRCLSIPRLRPLDGSAGIPFEEVEFVQRYWVDVFADFLAEYEQGLTPNPDLSCNRHIKVRHTMDLGSGESGFKFGALLSHVLQGGADVLATGHYARIAREASTQRARLLRGADRAKDQSYFLAGVKEEALRRVLFPLGSLQKSDVRRLAAEVGLPVAAKRSSAGICFVGHRNFADFLAEYVAAAPAEFVCVESGTALGAAPGGLPRYTHGQRACIAGAPEPWFVVGKDAGLGSLFVARGPDHPALFCTTAVADSLYWVAGQAPAALEHGKHVRFLYKARYAQEPGLCEAALMLAGSNDGSFVASRFCRLPPPVAAAAEAGPKHVLCAHFDTAARAVTPRQALVLYDGEECLGGGLVAHPGPSLFEQADTTARAAGPPNRELGDEPDCAAG
eukprot:SM000013S26521  [mRNA]  locus=s13:867611:869857:- [translate_table: standard]